MLQDKESILAVSAKGRSYPNRTSHGLSSHESQPKSNYFKDLNTYFDEHAFASGNDQTIQYC